MFGNGGGDNTPPVQRPHPPPAPSISLRTGLPLARGAKRHEWGWMAHVAK
jgi:hypothetical protein